MEGHTSSLDDPGVIYRATAANPQIDYYSENNQYHLVNKISSTSATCSKNGKTMYETICSGKREGSCTTRQTFVANGCKSDTYYSAAIPIEGVNFGTCTCKTGSGYFDKESDCNTALSNYNCPDDKTCTCEYNSGCYAVVEKAKYFKFTFGNSTPPLCYSGACTTSASVWIGLSKYNPATSNYSVVWEFAPGQSKSDLEPGLYRVFVSVGNGNCQGTSIQCLYNYLHVSMQPFTWCPKGNGGSNSCTYTMEIDGGAGSGCRDYFDWTFNAGDDKVLNLMELKCRSFTL